MVNIVVVLLVICLFILFIYGIKKFWFVFNIEVCNICCISCYSDCFFISFIDSEDEF